MIGLPQAVELLSGIFLFATNRPYRISDLESNKLTLISLRATVLLSNSQSSRTALNTIENFPYPMTH